MHGQIQKVPENKLILAIASVASLTLGVVISKRVKQIYHQLRYTFNAEPTKLVFVVRRDLKLTPGKLASQCSHAAVCCYKNSHPELAAIWEAQGQPKIVVGSLKSGEEELTNLASKAREQGLVSVIIRDAGRTQVSRNTVTVLGIGPDYSKSIDRLTAKYKLY